MALSGGGARGAAEECEIDGGCHQRCDKSEQESLSERHGLLVSGSILKTSGQAIACCPGIH